MTCIAVKSVCVCYVLLLCFYSVFFFKQKTAYEMRISDWSSDVCSSDLKCSLFRILALLQSTRLRSQNWIHWYGANAVIPRPFSLTIIAGRRKSTTPGDRKSVV